MYDVPTEIRDTARSLVEDMNAAENAPADVFDTEAYEHAEDAVIDWVREIASAAPGDIEDRLREDARSLVEALDEAENGPEANNDAQEYCDAEDDLLRWVHELAGLLTSAAR